MAIASQMQLNARLAVQSPFLGFLEELGLFNVWLLPFLGRLGFN